MLLRELNRGKCKTYLVACEQTRLAALIDPLRDHLDRYLAILAYHGLRLIAAIDTHSHADHRTAIFDLKELTDTTVVMQRNAPQPRVDRHVSDGETLAVGELTLTFLATPGHTPDSMCIRAGNAVFTGDTLLIGGTGRSDFAGGDAGAQYDSITRRLFTLPEETLVLPAHDYRGHTHSTIGEEKRLNPRLAGKSRGQYVELMNNLKLTLPDKIQEVLQPNQTALEDDVIHFPTLAQLNVVNQHTPQEVLALCANAAPPLLLDVREPQEFRGELGHIKGSILIPLNQLAQSLDQLKHARDRHIIAICRAGVRSTTAAAILTSMGFERVSNMKGGMLAWNDARLPVEH